MTDSGREKIKPAEPQDSLSAFRRSVREIVAKAEARNERGHFGDLFDADKLDEEDMKLYSDFKSKQIDIEDLRRKAMALKGSNNGSKKDFISYIISRIQEDILGGR